MGAVTVAIKKRNKPGAASHIVADVTGSASYATGGDTYTNAQFEAALGVDAIIDCGTPGYVLVPDLPNKKIRYFKGAAGLLVEETAAVNLSAVVSRVIAFCDNPYV